VKKGYRDIREDAAHAPNIHPGGERRVKSVRALAEGSARKYQQKLRQHGSSSVLTAVLYFLPPNRISGERYLREN
jgi:hypothetical protein